MAQGFAADARGAHRAPAAASTIFRVRALEGLEEELAAAFLGLWDRGADEVNDAVITLGPG